jgi:hypothetical protein
LAIVLSVLWPLCCLSFGHCVVCPLTIVLSVLWPLCFLSFLVTPLVSLNLFSWHLFTSRLYGKLCILFSLNNQWTSPRKLRFVPHSKQKQIQWSAKYTTHEIKDWASRIPLQTM